MSAVGVLGGTFDPVHCAHLRTAIEVREHLGLERLSLLPAPNPRLREPPVASPRERLAMLEAAVADVDGVGVDARELGRGGPTYTVDTLDEMAGELARAATPPRLVFVMGMDAFSRFDAWHRYERILELAHLVVARRPGSELPAAGPVSRLLAERRADDPAVLHAAAAGKIYVQDVPELDISATDIRARVTAGRSIQFLVPAAVRALIKEREIYRNAI